MQLIDTHCHLDFHQFDDVREEVLRRCSEEMEAVVNSGTNVARNQSALELAANHSFVYPTLGFHPTYVKEGKDLDTIEQQIRRHAENIVAVGEIGLDYHHVTDDNWRAEQEEIFRGFLEVAQELALPVVLHTRDAEKQALDVVKQYDVPAVVLHCFNGAPDLAQQAVDRDYWVSISTQVLYSSRVQNLAATVPLERILLETDAPFLYQSERNVPWNVHESAEKIAEVKGMEAAEVATVTTENARDALAL